MNTLTTRTTVRAVRSREGKTPWVVLHFRILDCKVYPNYAHLHYTHKQSNLNSRG